jgi:hypothetical protein
MSDINKIVAEEIVKRLKMNKLVPDDQKDLENKISLGIIKENEWKLIFDKQIKAMETQSQNATK